MTCGARDEHRQRHRRRQAQPLHPGRHELPVPGVPRAAPSEDDQGDADRRDLRPLPDDPAHRARAEADPPVRGLRRARRELPQGALRRVQGAPAADAARAGRTARDGAAGDRGVRADAARGVGLRGGRHHRDAVEGGAGVGPGRRDLFVGQGSDAALHRRRQRRRARHDEEPAHRPGRGAREVRRRSGAGGGRAGADGRQHRQRAGRGRHRAEDRVRADQQVRIAGRAAGGGCGGRRAGQARRRRSTKRATRSASRASWCACATTCRCRSRSRSCTGSIRTRRPLRALFTELEFSRLADQLSASGAAAIAPHAENTPAPLLAWCPSRSPRSRRRPGRRRSRSAPSWRRWPPRSGPRAPSGWRRCTMDRRPCVPTWSAWASRGATAASTCRSCHRYLGAPSCLPEAEALAVLAPLLASPEIAKHVHDAKTLEVLLLAPRREAGGRRVGLDAGSLPAGRVAHALRPGRRQRQRGDPARRQPGQLDRGRARRRRPAADISVEEVGALAGARRRRRRSALAAPQAAKLVAGGPGSALPRHGAAARARARAHRAAAASSSTPIGCARSGGRSARSWPRWRRRFTRSRGCPSTSTRRSSSPTCCSASCRCRSCARPRPAHRPTPTRWRSWRRCTRCRRRSSTTACSRS